MSAFLAMHSGRIISLADPDPALIDIEDIAWNLSHINRWVGALDVPYSVAQHSVIVSSMFGDPEHALKALLHDAAEAYLGDVSYPLKELLPEYKAIEERWEAVLVAVLGVDWRGMPGLKSADTMALLSEAECFGNEASIKVVEMNLGRKWPSMGALLEPWTPEQARSEFLRRYYELREQMERTA